MERRVRRGGRVRNLMKKDLSGRLFRSLIGRELERERNLFQQTFELAAIGIGHVSPDGKWLRVNRALCDTLHYPAEDLLRLGLREVTHPDDFAEDQALMKSILDGEISSYSAERRYLCRGGSHAWVHITVALVRSGAEPDHFIWLTENIQAKKQAEQATIAVREQYRSLFEQMPEGLLLLDEELRVIDHNREAARHLEIPREELLGMHLLDFEAVEDDEEAEMKRGILEESGRIDFESRYRTRSGRIIDVDVSIRMVHLLEGRPGYQTLFRDITEERQAAQQIEHLAYHDQLTGLPNRRLLQDRTAQAIRDSARRETNIAVFYLDLDHFKDVNDTLGHQAGDLLLQTVAGRLLRSVRAGDTLARIGGDEFVVMLKDISNSEVAADIARKIIQEVGAPYLIGDDELRVTPSIGISIFPQDGRDAEDLIKHADAALYQAKRSGRATYHFYTRELHERTVERLKMERLLHRALEKREFELYYQPQVDLQSRKIVGCEALIRWNHPAMGQVSPARFIPVAEHSSLILEIGEWVIRESFRQAKIWQDRGLDLKLSFNVSARQFMRPGELLDILRDAIGNTGVKPSNLEMELTESLLLDQQGIGDALNEIRSLGMQIALDDFGTGYSSLSYLRRFPISTLKIDRSFVSESDRDEDDATMVKTIIGMAKNLRMGVVAEGVETGSQAILLSAYGCRIAQGYHFSLPLPLQEFETLLELQQLPT